MNDGSVFHEEIQGDFHTKSLGGLLERGQNSCNEI